MDGSTNRIRIKTKLKMTPSNLNKSVNLSTAYASNIPQSNKMRGQFKRINKNLLLSTGRQNDSQQRIINFPREPNIAPALNILQNSVTFRNHKRKTSLSNYKVIDSLNMNDSTLINHDSSLLMGHQKNQQTISFLEGSMNLAPQRSKLNDDMIRTINAYNQSVLPRNYMN